MLQYIGKKIILVFLILTALALSLLHIAKNQNWQIDRNVVNQSEEVASTTTVLITQSGFSASTITIKKGDAIIFKNDDTENHWPASDPHPGHSIYPEFDPKNPLQAGESWSFTFDKVGDWRFHDHENPLWRGRVVVLPLGSGTNALLPNDKQTGSDCLTTSLDFACYEDHYDKLVANSGVTAAFADLKTRYEKNPYIQSQCHPLTHVIGRAAVQLYPQVSDAFTKGNSLCWSGYYHGVMEGIIGKIGKEDIVAKLDSICTSIPGKVTYSFDYYNCVHGLGHGLMALTSNELFESLKICDNLSGSWEESSCYGGVFMENVIVDNKNHFTKYLKPSEPLYPCSAVGEIYKNPCYLMQTSYMLKVSNNDFKKVFDLCATVESGFELLCYQSLGRDASGQSISHAEMTKRTCELGADYVQKSNCIIGAVKDFVSFYHSDVEARHLCEILDQTLKQICLDTTTSYYKSF